MEEESITRLSTLSHPQRLAVFRLLMRRYPDQLRAGEIAGILELKASTTSVYLAALTDAGLIRQRREGTSLRYCANTAAAAELIDFLFVDCCRGRPELCPPLIKGAPPMTDTTYNVLFICTGNSARSIFAEAILRDVDATRFTAYSAGTKPASRLNPLAIEMLKGKGHDVTMLHAKHTSEFQKPESPRMDFVFTVCDQAANEECPPWDGQPISAHWGLPDPVKATGSLAEKRLAFQQTYGLLRNRLKAFAALPIETLDAISLQAAVDTLGQDHLEGTPA
ncbi:arsenate reductase/protein-tyrosine-phosphatase family protein [Roseobacter sinensis]|uniref:Helix-turn-helix domain-containing protein n=1 Tax=Roseobacter sinensis TaxID=2931391 RepID=A0ABT3BIU1_9RHOB|nr:helix-turn-helix domain-containing protein [Roseobacter sp. WL0113]MCV3273044.1 helix-turn-helix domain-containing protein [Roseobacter sp. WL0113]